MTASPPHIGTLREGPLHASLKQWCAQDGDRFEVPIAGYVIDVVRGEMLIEVQTGGFSSMKRKLQELLDFGHHVRVLYPIPVRKSIVKVDADGEVVSRRRSPKRGDPLDIFSELVSIPQLIAHPGFELELVLTVEDEYRKHDPSRAWRRRGWVVMERRLVEIEGTVTIADVPALATFLPDDLPEPFTTSDLASAVERPLRLAQQMAYCLRHCAAIEPVGKRGNAVEYRRTPNPTVLA